MTKTQKQQMEIARGWRKFLRECKAATSNEAPITRSQRRDKAMAVARAAINKAELRSRAARFVQRKSGAFFLFGN